MSKAKSSGPSKGALNSFRQEQGDANLISIVTWYGKIFLAMVKVGRIVIFRTSYEGGRIIPIGRAEIISRRRPVRLEIRGRKLHVRWADGDCTAILRFYEV